LVGTSEGGASLGKPKRRLKENYKVDLKYYGLRLWTEFNLFEIN